MRVILDTNVLLSGLLSSVGAPSRLLDAWEHKSFTFVACDSLILEFRNVADRPFFRPRLRPSLVELIAAGLRDFSLFFQNLEPGPVAPDRKDSYLLALAEAGQSDFLVTGDKQHLLLKQHKVTLMIPPAEMFAILPEF